MSVQFSPQDLDHCSPAFDKAIQLLHLARVTLGDFLKLGHLLLHKREVIQRPQACTGHFGIPNQSVAAQNDAAIGFGRAHGGVA